MAINFLKTPQHMQRRVNSHTLLPHLYLYSYLEDNVGYVLHEPATKSLIAIDTGEFEKS